MSAKSIYSIISSLIRFWLRSKSIILQIFGEVSWIFSDLLFLFPIMYLLCRLKQKYHADKLYFNLLNFVLILFKDTLPYHADKLYFNILNVVLILFT